ncbi:phosphate acetyltransferase [Campylobacter subantarcticus]|uniref:Phosphate acetyltransferase n=1 Tax=Campylobacter subantarcticus LMG 24374 TaxID=1388751 RepID=A0A0A8HA53_9BACT|nr:phosphate acetyltransferase [Campylobacter subantarcticus LMG 24374]EAJ1260602.1 phosphate acetyltransferase [Campylobacter lari]
MKSMFLLDCTDMHFLQQCLERVQGQIAFYFPVFSEKNKEKIALFSAEKKLKVDFSYSFEKNDYQAKITQNSNDFFKKIIEDFEAIKKENDFIVVLGVDDFGLMGDLNFNISLAKELNTPVYAKCQDKNYIMLNFLLSQKLNQYVLLKENETFDQELLQEYNYKTQARFSYELFEKAKADKKIVVLPESFDERVLKASEFLIQNEIVDLILLGDSNEICAKANSLNINIDGVHIINPKNSQYNEEFEELLYEARKNKGMSKEEAKKLVQDKTYFATMLVHTQKAHAMVSGASTTTAETIRPALQIIKTKPDVSLVSGMFFMSLEDKVLVFADCAVMPNPTPAQLAEIAYVSANSAKSFGLDPKVALLSYSSGDSGSGASVDAIKEATKIAREKYPQLEVEGPIQFDAAYDILTAKSKMPNSKVAGRANVYVFPDLNAANICYKAVQRTANSLAIGPILQGLKKPINDLSRGCLVEDIINTVILSAIQA